MRHILSKIRKAIEDYDMIEEGDRIIGIIAPNNFIMGVIRDKYLDKLKIELGKEIALKERKYESKKDN